MSKNTKARINQQINVSRVRLIDADGEQIGVVSIKEAMQKAEDAGLDLVEISPSAEPPVCKVMDFGKYLFDQNKKRHVARKKQKQKQVGLKEMKFRPVTDEGDYQVKLKKLHKFLEQGNKTKIIIVIARSELRFRARGEAHQKIGMELLQRIRTDLEDCSIVEHEPSRESRQQLMMVLAPKKQV